MLFKVSIYMQSLHLISSEKSSICKVSIYVQSQSLCLIFKLSTRLFAVKFLLSTKTYINLISFLYNYICKHYHYSRKSSSSSVLLTLQDPLQDLLSVSSSFPFVSTKLHYLLDIRPIILCKSFLILFARHLIK